MRILFDQGTPAPLRRHLHNHEVDTAFELGWSNLHNGELLDRAEAAGYEVLVTTDQQLRHQQNLDDRRLCVLVLLTTSWPRLRSHVDLVREGVDAARPGEYRELAIP